METEDKSSDVWKQAASFHFTEDEQKVLKFDVEWENLFQAANITKTLEKTLIFDKYPPEKPPAFL